MKRGILHGYYGYGNFGDDLFLYFLTKYFIPKLATKEYSFVVPVGGSCFLPEEVVKLSDSVIFERYRTDTVLRRIRSKFYLVSRLLVADLLIYGGGTFLYEKTGVKRMKSNLNLMRVFFLKTPCYLIGLGIGVDPITNPIMKRLSEKILKKFSYIVFRDKYSLNNALQIVGPCINTKSLVLPDLAYGLMPEVAVRDFSQQIPRSIGINFTIPLDCLNESLYIDAMREFVNKLMKNGFDVYIIIAQPYLGSKEMHLAEKIAPTFPKNKIISYEGDISTFLKKISLMEVIVGSKLHVLIASHILGKPFFAIKYQEKIEYFMKEAGYESHLFTYEQTDSLFNLILHGKYDKPTLSPISLYKRLNEGLKEVLKTVE